MGGAVRRHCPAAARFFHAHLIPNLRAELWLRGVKVLVQRVKQFDEFPGCQRRQDLLRPAGIGEVVEKL
jgi:hypothetical protein